VPLTFDLLVYAVTLKSNPAALCSVPLLPGSSGASEPRRRPHYSSGPAGRV